MSEPHYFQLDPTYHLQTTTTAAGLSAGGIGRDGGNVLNAANLHSIAGEGAEGGLRSGSGAAGLVAAGAADLDVEGGDAELLASEGDVLGGKHGGVRAGLVAVGLDLHAAGDADEGLAAGEVGNVDEGVIEGGEQVGNAEYFLALHDLGGELRVNLAVWWRSGEIWIEKRVLVHMQQRGADQLGCHLDPDARFHFQTIIPTTFHAA